ncbi:hypothetical protein FOZ62_031190 [Perkinsus olseni]|uniref:Cilia- and flagella-associated protein 69 ARM repeats domain-containing protein n=1 Tax=Perkinsus olseni TaxID=32597 RepID=A0A7J6QKI5_PEROL|nr:hypothetical protein FOZ62_031190 [Perkinsus olseni]
MSSVVRGHHPTFDLIFFQLEAPHTAGLIERHVEVAKYIASSRSDGWRYSELPDLTELLKRLVELFDDRREVEILNAIRQLLENCCHPFISEKASDVMVYGGELPRLVEVVGTCGLPTASAAVEDTPEVAEVKKNLRSVIAEFITALAKTGQSEVAEREVSREAARSVLAATGTANLRVIFEARDVLDQLAEEFRRETDLSVAVKMLLMFRDLAVFRPLCERLVNLGLPILVLRLLRGNLHKTGEVVLVATELLGTFMELDAVNASVACGSADFFEVVSDILNELVSLSAVKYKICRNDLAAIVMLIIETGSAKIHQQLASSGLLSLLLFWTKVVESPADYNQMRKLTQERVRHLKPLTNPQTVFDVSSLRAGRMGSAEDVQFRIISWRATALAASSDEQCAKEAESFGFIKTLLATLEGGDVSGGSTEYAARLEDAALSALSRLLEGDVGLRKAFGDASGVSVLLRYVQGLASELRSGGVSADMISYRKKSDLLRKSLSALMIGLEFVGLDGKQEGAAEAVPLLCGIIAADGDFEKRSDALPPMTSQPPQPWSVEDLPTINSPPVISLADGDDDMNRGIIPQASPFKTTSSPRCGAGGVYKVRVRFTVPVWYFVFCAMFDPGIDDKIFEAVVTGDDAAATQCRSQALRQSVAGLSPLVVSKLDKEFWAAKATAILGSVEDEATVRQLLVASAVAAANELDRYIASTAAKARKSTAKQRVVDSKKLLEKLTAKLGCSLPSSLIPPIEMVSRLKNGEFVELQEFKFSDGQSWAATGPTTVSGDTVEILVDAFSAPKQKPK